MAPKGVEQAADELYGLPLGDFTKRRNELAKQLRNDGKGADADAVKALRKPTAAAWALNQIARRRPKEIERLLATGKRLREAHEALYSGGDRTRLQKVSGEEREQVDKLTRDATAIAGEAGTAATANLDEQIRNTLHAAALDEETAGELSAGRLLRERAAVGMFGTAPPESQARSKPASKPKRTAKLERELAALRKAQQKAEREHDAAAKAAERARSAATKAQQRADEAARREQEAARNRERSARAVAAAEKKLR